MSSSAPNHDVENPKDLPQRNERLKFDQEIKKIQEDINKLQAELESFKETNDIATCDSIQKNVSHPQQKDNNYMMQPNTVDEQENHQNKGLISTNDIKNIVESLLSNEDFKHNLDKSVQEKVDSSLSDLVQAQSTQQTNARPITRTNSLTGIASSPMRKGRMEEDMYSMMMISFVQSKAWFFGIICFIMQMTLATIIIIEQTQTKFLETDMSIPIKVSILPRIAQVLAVILAIMTQNEFLMGIRTIMMLSYKDKSTWGSVIGIAEDKCNKRLWFLRIFIPNCLKSIQGGMVLVASFIVIIQIDTIVDVLKDYSALFVVSSVDNLFFNFADMGYLGEKLSIKTEKMRDMKLAENEQRVWKRLAALLGILITAFMAAYIYITVGQVNGKYIIQAYPICPVEEKVENGGKTFLDIVGDGRCQYPQGQGTNINECGWDGGDCEIINERFPKCTVNDFSLLGDGQCEAGIYNTDACGFDNGDCVDFNLQKQDEYPDCNVENIGWVGDGICNGGEYLSDNCKIDGGDCANCAVDDINLVGDGTCDDSAYNNEACGFDGGDCVDFNLQKQKEYPDCNVENIGWVGDGICNGGDYASDECDNDGRDCANCAVDDINRVGDGTCDDSAYNYKGCSFDGGDCVDFNLQKQDEYPDCNVTNIGWIEDGVCDEENNIDGCLFDGNDCVPSMKLIGDKYDGNGKWFGGVVGRDGNIYGIPFDMNKILKIDPSANATNPTALVGDDLGDGGAKWRGGVVGNDGIIYGLPYIAKSILSYNPTTEKTQLIAENHPLLESEWKFAGGVLAENGMIYFIPYYSNKVIKFDPSNLENPLTEIGDDLGDQEWKMVGGVLGSDGNIYAIPSNGNRVLKINVANDTTSFIGDDYPGGRKWWNGILAQDGNIYACPYWANQILQINVQSQTTKLVGPDFDDDFYYGYYEGGIMWSGFVEGEDGFLYGMPYDSNQLLRFDPIHHTATSILLPLEWHGWGKWQGGVRAENGFIYGIPYHADQVLSIAPLKFRP